MLRWAVIFLIIGLVAGILGFTGIAGASFAIAKISVLHLYGDLPGAADRRPHLRAARDGRIAGEAFIRETRYGIHMSTCRD